MLLETVVLCRKNVTEPLVATEFKNVKSQHSGCQVDSGWVHGGCGQIALITPWKPEDPFTNVVQDHFPRNRRYPWN